MKPSLPSPVHQPGMLDRSGGIDQYTIEIEDDGFAEHVCHSCTSFRGLHSALKQRFPVQDSL
jgi:hypothetical protein